MSGDQRKTSKVNVAELEGTRWNVRMGVPPFSVSEQATKRFAVF